MTRSKKRQPMSKTAILAGMRRAVVRQQDVDVARRFADLTERRERQAATPPESHASPARTGVAPRTSQEPTEHPTSAPSGSDRLLARWPERGTSELERNARHIRFLHAHGAEVQRSIDRRREEALWGVTDTVADILWDREKEPA